MRSSAFCLNRRALLVSSCILLARHASALDPASTVGQYLHERWGSAQGLPQGRIYAITQTKDGYLWVGSEAGLYRFDGVSFAPWRDEGSTPIALDQVFGLEAGMNGSLWARLSDPTLVRYHDGIFAAITDMGQTEDPRVTAIAHGTKGQLLFASRRGGVASWTGKQFAPIVSSARLPQSPVISIAQTEDGDTWLGTREGGLVRVDASGGLSVFREGLPDLKVNCLLAGEQRELFIGTENGLVRWDGSRLSSVPLPLAFLHKSISALARDRDANIWIGTSAGALLRLNSRGVSFQNALKPENPITALYEDREGDLWVGDTAGLQRIRESTFSTYVIPQATARENNGPLYAGSQGATWFAPDSGGLYWLDKTGTHNVHAAGLERDVIYSIAGASDGVWVGRQRGGLTHLRLTGESVSATTYTTADGLTQNSVYSLRVGQDGSVWAGTLNAGVAHLQDGRFTNYGKADGLAANTVTSIAETVDGTLWFGTPAGLSSFSGNTWKTYGLNQGLPSADVYSLCADSDGELWVGTLKGLAVIRAAHVTAVLSPILREAIFGLAEDRTGYVWVVTPRRLLSVSKRKLETSGIISEDGVREYGLADGLGDMRGVRRDGSVVSDPSGRILVSRSFGIAVVDPVRIAKETVPTIVHLEGISVDGSALGEANQLRIQPDPKRITISFEGLNLAIPNRIGFRYKLDGFDQSWSPANSAKQAVYTNLSPGSYRFRVTANNGEGVWNGSEASLSFTVEPSVWQTGWFRAVILLLMGLGSFWVYHLRIRQMTEALNLRFDERLAERTRLARELHDTLLQTIQGSKMVADDALDEVDGRPPDAARMRTALERLTVWLEEAIQEGRRALNSLRIQSSSDDDLATALQRVAQDCTRTGTIKTSFLVEGDVRQMHPVIRDEIYRIGYEAIRNACRHSEGNRLEIELDYDRHFTLRVRDNGCGISAEVAANGKAGHFGLVGMHERAERVGGRLNLFSASGSGTEVELVIPGGIAFNSNCRKIQADG